MSFYFRSSHLFSTAESHTYTFPKSRRFALIIRHLLTKVEQDRKLTRPIIPRVFHNDKKISPPKGIAPPSADSPWMSSPAEPQSRITVSSIQDIRKHFGLSSALHDSLKPLFLDQLGKYIFLAYDFKARCDNQNITTEAGFCVLDPLRIMDKVPGDRGINWMSKLHTRHIRVRRQAYPNTKYVRGNPELFCFGVTEWMYKTKIPSNIAAWIHDLRIIPPSVNLKETLPFRKVVLVGYGNGNDAKYARNLGIEWPPTATTSSIDLQRSIMKLLPAFQGSQPDFRRAMDAFGLPWNGFGENLDHNSGNDAVFTMQLFIAHIAMTSDQDREMRTNSLPLLPDTWLFHSKRHLSDQTGRILQYPNPDGRKAKVIN